MEDEVCYSTVIFKTLDDKTQEESVVYAEVKRNKLTSEDPPESSGKGVTAPISPPFRRATVFWGLLCFLLLSALIAVSIYYQSHAANYNKIVALYNEEKMLNQQLLKQKDVLEREAEKLTIQDHSHVANYSKIVALYNEEKTLNQQLLKQKDVLEGEAEKLTIQGEELNGTLDYILRHIFAKQYCNSTEKGVRCKSCPRSWIQNGSSCYYLANMLLTWTESKELCKTHGAHLAIIDNVEEQKFVNQHTAFYYNNHGYWIGLSRQKSGQAGTWVWTSGAKLERGFWIGKSIIPNHWETQEYCVLSMTSRDPLKSWHATQCSRSNRCICEMAALTWPEFLRE